MLSAYRERLYPILRRGGVVATPLASLALVFTIWNGRAAADGGPPTLGVGGVVSLVDSTGESFNVFRAMTMAAPTIHGRAARVVLVDNPAEADYAVTGKVTGSIILEHEPDRFEHDLKLELKVWSHGKKVGTTRATCKGSMKVGPGGPPDYRFDALAPCVRSQMGELVRVIDAS